MSTRYMNPGEMSWRNATLNRGESARQFDTSQENAMKQAARIAAANAAAADDAAQMQKMQLIAGGLGSVASIAGGYGLGALASPSSADALKQYQERLKMQQYYSQPYDPNRPVYGASSVGLGKE